MSSHTAPIVGAHFRPPAKALLAALPSTQPLFLRPEPSNPHDENAIQVLLATETLAPLSDMAWAELEVHLQGQGFDREAILSAPEWHLGYLPKTAKGNEEQQATNVALQLAVAEALFQSQDYAESWPASLTFDSAGKPCVQFDLPEG